jgi:hypothetical protein
MAGRHMSEQDPVRSSEEHLVRVDDNEAADVSKILGGAYRGPRDPDLELVAIVARLRGATDADTQSILVDLIRHAHSH